MARGRAAGRAVAVAAVLLLLPVLSEQAAYAVLGLYADDTDTTAVDSGTWAAVATTASAAPYSSAALALTYAKNGNSAPAAKYYWLVSTGTLPLTAVTTTLTSTATAKAEICSGTWNETTGVCVGTVTALDTTTTTGGTTTSVSLAAGARVRVKASITVAISGATTLTVNESVPRTGTRAKTTTNS